MSVFIEILMIYFLVKSKILDALRGAGPIGLHINDLLDILDPSLDIKQVSMKLNDLLVRDSVQVVCEDFWKIKEDTGLFTQK